MIRVAIVEDEVSYQEQLVSFLRNFEKDWGGDLEVKIFSDGDEFVENYHAQFEIILMDIQMHFMNGMTAAEEIRKMDSEVVIIFITNLAHYAIKGYSVDALDFILKPISYFQFSQRLHRAVDRMKNRDEQHIKVKAKGGVQRFKVSDIYFVESQGHNLIFYSKLGEFVATGTIKDLEEQLSSYHFFRANKGYLINLKYVDGMNDLYAIVNDKELQVSRNKRKAFLEALSAYWGEVVK